MSKDTLKQLFQSVRLPSKNELLLAVFVCLMGGVATATWLFLKADETIAERASRVKPVETVVSLARAGDPEQSTKAPDTIDPDIVPPIPTPDPEVLKELDQENDAQSRLTDEPDNDIFKDVDVIEAPKADVTDVEEEPLTAPSQPDPLEAAIQETPVQDTPVDEGFETENTISENIAPIEPIATDEDNAPAMPQPVKAVTLPEHLIENTENGPLPKISRDGVAPRDFYAKQTPVGTTTHKIALIVTDIGLSEGATQSALENLPASVTMAVNPYGKNLLSHTKMAANKGHETLIMVPMEPYNFPVNDPGPRALLTSISKTQNMERLHWVLSRITGYTGAISHMGNAFFNDGQALDYVFDDLSKRGLLFVNATAPYQQNAAELAKADSLPFFNIDLKVDDIKTDFEIEKQLNAAEIIAADSGYAIIYTGLSPLSLKMIEEWLPTLEKKNIEIVPLSYFYKKTTLPE